MHRIRARRQRQARKPNTAPGAPGAAAATATAIGHRHRVRRRRAPLTRGDKLRPVLASKVPAPVVDVGGAVPDSTVLSAGRHVAGADAAFPSLLPCAWCSSRRSQHWRLHHTRPLVLLLHCCSSGPSGRREAPAAGARPGEGGRVGDGACRPARPPAPPPSPSQECDRNLGRVGMEPGVPPSR